MKKVHLSVLMVVMVLILAACGSNGDKAQQAQGGQSQDENAGSTSAPASGDVVKITFGEALAEDHPLAIGSYRFKALVEEKSAGAIVIDIFPNQQLGSLRELVESTQMGAIHMTRSIASMYSSFIPELQVLEYPYLMPTSEQEMQKMLNGEVGEAIKTSFEDYGLRALGFWPQGFKHITSNKPLYTPEDLRGVKMRVIPSNILIDQYEAWGAVPVAIDFAELYMALQQGTADAQENPLDSIYSTRMYEVQDHLSMFNHAYQLNIISVNKAWFDGLAQEHQTIIQEAHDQVIAEYREDYEALTQSLLDSLVAEGMEIHQLSEEQIEVFRQLSLPLHDRWVDGDKQQALLDLIRSTTN